MAKIGINKTVGQAKTGTMRVQNATASGFGIIYADEIIGHRRVDTFEDLAKIPNWALYDSKGGDNISTAKGQLWYVSGDSKLYQLTGIDASGANRTWTEFKGTDSSYSLPLMSTTQRGGAKLASDTTQTVGANPVTTTVNRTYAVQKNASEQLVVNVPWIDTNNNTTYTFANGTDGSFTVTPSGGTAQKVEIGIPANATHANTASSAANATHATNATNADKATKDGEGNIIKDTYATKSEISALTSALVYKGTVDATHPLPTQDVKVGDVYVVAAPGTYVEQKCENGDMIIAKVGGNTPKWTVVQTNIDGAVTTTTTLTDNSIILGNGNKTLKTFAPLTTDGYLYWSGSEYAWKKPEEFSLTHATDKALGGIKIGYTAPTSNNRQYAVKLGTTGDNTDKAYVEVPWTNIPPVATKNVLGGIKTNYAPSGKNYAIRTDTDGNAFVSVNWADPVTYTAGSGINISDNIISLNDKLQKHLYDALNTENFGGYVVNVAKGVGSNGNKDQSWLTYKCNTTGTLHDIVQIFDSYSKGANGLASIKSVGAVAANLQSTEDNLHEQINNVGSALNNKVNTADKITEADINALFTNN